MTRVGDVSFTSNTLTANQFRASIYGGVFYLQLPAISQSAYLYRAVTAGDHMYTAHVAPQIAGAQPAGAAGANCYFFVSASLAGRPDGENATVLGNISSDANWHSITRIAGFNTNDSTRAYDIPSAVGTADQFVGTVRTSWVYNLDDGRAMRFQTGAPFTPTRAFFGFAFTTTTRQDDCIFSLYFLRELPAPTSWWVSTAPSTGGGGGGGGGGDIVEIVAGTGITVTNGTGPVVTVAATGGGGGGTLAGDANGPAASNTVNAIHETSGPTQLSFGPINDFQLLQRVGATVVGTAYPPTTLVGDVNGAMTSNQVNAIHETSGPTQLTLGAIANGQVLQRVGNTIVGVAGGLPTGNPYIDPPLVANAFDDEFDSGSPDLAIRGWTVKTTAGVTLTRAGDIDPWNSSGPAAGTYWSTLKGSQILLQFPTSTTSTLIFKAISLSPGDTYFTRIGGSARADGTSVAQGADVGLSANSAGLPDLANNVYVTSYSTNTGGENVDMARTTGGAFSGITKTVGIGALGDIRGVHWTSGTSFYPFLANSSNGDTMTSAPAGAVNGSTIEWFTIRYNPITTAFAGTLPWILSIDFARKTTGTAWIAQTPKVSVTGTYAGLPSGNPYIDPPAVASSFDDEFESGSADLATRGWTVRNTSVGTSMSRVGDIDPFDTSLTSGQYRSRLVGSQLLIQLPQGADVAVYKAFTTTGCYLWVRGGAPLSTAGTTAQNLFGVATWGNSGGVIDTNNRTYTGVIRGTSAPSMIGASIVGGSYSEGLFTDGNLHIPDICIQRCSSTSTYRHMFAASSAGSNSVVERSGSSPNLSNIAYAGFLLWKPSTTGSTTDTQIFSIDFFRVIQSTANTWIANTPRPVLWNVVNGNITDYTAKPAPVAADQIYIADSAASNAIRRSTLGVAAPSNMFWAPGPSTDPFDDFFADGSPDLAIRGWLAVNGSTGATMTRVGDILPMIGPSTLATNTYRSTLTRSGLLIQCKDEFVIAKAVSGSFVLLVNISTSISSTTTMYRFLMLSSTLSNLGGGTSFYRTQEYNGQLQGFLQNAGSNSVAWAQSQPAGVQGINSTSSFVTDWDASTHSWTSSTWDPTNCWAGAIAGAAQPALTVNYAGVGMNANENAAYRWCVLRAMRKLPQGSFPGLS